MNAIACLWQRHPWSRILLAQYNFKLAYWSLHCHWQIAIQCIMVHDNLAYLVLWLTILLVDPEWSLDELHSPIQQEFLNNILLLDKLPFSPALPMTIDPATPDSRV